MPRRARRRIARWWRGRVRARGERVRAIRLAEPTARPADRMWQDVRDAFLPRLDRRR